MKKSWCCTRLVVWLRILIISRRISKKSSFSLDSLLSFSEGQVLRQTFSCLVFWIVLETFQKNLFKYTDVDISPLLCFIRNIYCLSDTEAKFLGWFLTKSNEVDFLFCHVILFLEFSIFVPYVYCNFYCICFWPRDLLDIGFFCVGFQVEMKSEIVTENKWHERTPFKPH